MNTNEHTRRPEEIEDDIERTRAEVGATIEAIQEKLTPGQMMDQALQYLRSSGAGDFGKNLGRQVRDNPLPVALIGVGVAWLAMGGRMRTDLSPWDDAPPMRSHRTSTAYATGDLGGTAYEDDWPDTTRADLDEPGLGSRIAEAGSSAGARVHDAVSGTTGRVKDTMSSAARRARDLAHDAGSRLGSVGEGVRTRAGALQGSTRTQVHRARERTMRMVDEQPLVLGAIGVAIGAALGAALPSTRREDRLLGSTRDGLLEGTGDAARDGMRGVASSAQRVARTAREEVERAIDTPPADDGASASRTGTGSGSGTGTGAMPASGSAGTTAH
jgi:ElaB/YqjD/DUF883 family membrane-anchored ribosome-binding protein